MSKFKSIREKALNFWFNSTSRSRKWNEFNDDFSDSLECDWQVDLVDEDMHNSIFCSFGEWNNNITDLLLEKSYDNLRFSKEEEKQKLFRHYTRIMLVLSESLTDVRDLIIKLNNYTGSKKQKNNKANKRIGSSSLEFSVFNLFTYINNICKHKVGNANLTYLKYHSCNHHLKYNFKDSPSFARVSNSITTTNSKVKKMKREIQVEVPKLEDLLIQLIHAYTILDKDLNRKGNKKHIRSILKKFETPLKFVE